MNFRTISDLNNLINKNMNLIPSDIDLVVGVPRSGMLPASIISLMRNCQLTDFESMLNYRIYECGTTKRSDNWIATIEDARKILIVEDSIHSGRSIKRIKEQLIDFKYKDKILILAIYVSKESEIIPDIFFEICEPPRFFEWNYLHHSMIEKSCFDIDGVLCRDPSSEENDDGINYINFIKNVELRVKPSRKIDNIVTSRLEKYRNETKEWLSRNNIEYNNLIMMQVETMKERQQLSNHALHKANCYKNAKDNLIFIESSLKQAEEISILSQKAVFSIENQVFFEARGLNQIKNSMAIKKSVLKSKLKRYKIIRDLLSIRRRINKI